MSGVPLTQGLFFTLPAAFAIFTFSTPFGVFAFTFDFAFTLRAGTFGSSCGDLCRVVLIFAIRALVTIPLGKVSTERLLLFCITGAKARLSLSFCLARFAFTL